MIGSSEAAAPDPPAGAATTGKPGAAKEKGHRRRKPPSGRGKRGVEKPASRCRPPKWAAASNARPVAVIKTVRGLRSPAVQGKMLQAHEAVVSALMEEDKKIDVGMENDGA